MTDKIINVVATSAAALIWAWLVTSTIVAGDYFLGQLANHSYRDIFLVTLVMSFVFKLKEPEKKKGKKS